MSALAWRGAGLVVVVALIALWGEIAAAETCLTCVPAIAGARVDGA